MSLSTFFERRIGEIRYAMRMIWKTPGISLVAILSLALGIGANTAIFSLVDTMLLKRLPVRSPQELYQVATGQNTSWNYPDYVAFRDHNRSFSGLAAYSTGVQPLGMQTGNGGAGDLAEIAYTLIVSGNYFGVLGVQPALGRLFDAEDDRKPGGAPYVVLSFDYWQGRFGGDPDMLGRKIRLNGYSFTVVGVTRRGFRGTDVTTSPHLFIPLMMRSEATGSPFTMWNSRHYWWMQVIGRLRAGATTAQAETELSGVYKEQAAAERRAAPNTRVNEAKPIVLRPAARGYSYVRNRLEKPLLVLMTVVALVLLIACANVANLMLARGAARQREMAVRLAVGATRMRLTSQLLVESLLIALMGGVSGLFFAYLGVHAMLEFVPQIGSSQTAVNVSPDLRLLGFTFAVSLVTGVLFGIAPALQCTRPDLVPVLKDEVPGSIGLSRFTLRNALVVIQVALSLLLLIGASLFVRSLSNLREIETGFRRDQTLIVFVDPSRNGYKGQRLRDFYERLRENVERMPGVQSSSLAFITPLSGMRWNGDFVAEGYQWKPGDEKVVDMNAVGPRYFETVGIPILVGRDFRPDDNPPRSLDPPTTLSGGMKPPDLPGRRVAIINESMAKSFFAGRSPIGMRVCMGEEFDAGQAFEIVGVVGDVRYLDLREAFEPMIYLPVWRSTPRSTALCIRTSSDAARILDAVRHQVSALDPAVPMLNSGTLQQQINNNILEDRLITTLSGFFGLLALLLAAVGLYGVISYAVTRRTREIGIRMALGAQRTEVAQLVLRDAALMVATGAAIGIPTSLAATRLVQSFLFGISAQDPLAIGLGAAALAAAAAIACYMPARRATKVDPMVALRYE